MISKKAIKKRGNSQPKLIDKENNPPADSKDLKEDATPQSPENHIQVNSNKKTEITTPTKPEFLSVKDDNFNKLHVEIQQLKSQNEFL